MTSLGVLQPTQGQQALLLTSQPSTGTTPGDATISLARMADIDIPNTATHLRLDYNLLTNEPNPSLANDRFSVTLVWINSQGESILEVDTFDTLHPAPLTGYRRQTGFRTLIADVSAYAGSPELVTLDLRLSEGGDGRLDSAVLLDHLHFTGLGTPQAIANVDYLELAPSESFAFDGFSSTDPDGDIVEYRWDFGNGTIAYGPIAEYLYATAGVYQSNLTVTDTDDNTHTDTFIVVVGEVTSAPQIVSTPPQLVSEHTVYQYDVEAQDADLTMGDHLTFSLTQAPIGMTIDPVSGVIAWTPTAESPRQTPVTVQVTDLQERSATQSFTVTVGPAELVVAANDNGEVFVARHQGNGTFGPLEFVEKTAFYAGVALADFDGDGDFDFVTGHGADPVLVLYYFENQGDRFASPALIGTVGDSTTRGGTYLQDLAAADINADGLMDFAVNGDAQTTWLFQRDNALEFGQETFLATDFETDTGGWGTPTCQSDLSLDSSTSNSGSQSLRVVASGNNSCLSIRIAPGSWDLFQGPQLIVAYRIPTGTPVGLAVDVTSFGRLFLGGSPSATPGMYSAVDAVQFIDDNNWHTATINLAQAVRQHWPQAVRLDHLEWYTASNAPAGSEFWLDDVSVTRRTVASGFAVHLLPQTGGNGRGLDAADVNNDGHIDFVRGQRTSGQLHLYLGDGTGQFTTSQVADVGATPTVSPWPISIPTA